MQDLLLRWAAAWTPGLWGPCNLKLKALMMQDADLEREPSPASYLLCK